jgi:integrase
VADVKEEDGVWFLDLAGRRLKTGAAYRRIPLHSEVLNLGFLDYVKSVRGEEYLFPSLGEPDEDGRRGTYMGKRFGRHRKSLGVDRPRVGFHSFRATVATKLENAGVQELHAARLVGHKVKTMTYGLYSGGLSLSQLRDVVEALEYKGLKLL